MQSIKLLTGALLVSGFVRTAAVVQAAPITAGDIRGSVSDALEARALALLSGHEGASRSLPRRRS